MTIQNSLKFTICINWGTNGNKTAHFNGIVIKYIEMCFFLFGKTTTFHDKFALIRNVMEGYLFFVFSVKFDQFTMWLFHILLEFSKNIFLSRNFCSTDFSVGNKYDINILSRFSRFFVGNKSDPPNRGKKITSIKNAIVKLIFLHYCHLNWLDSVCEICLSPFNGNFCWIICERQCFVSNKMLIKLQSISDN